ncbi:SMI1/KNR4 family protein [Streptomyces microflavus]|uniref:SMI1/KNR4 family protein n=1 Tax=Streptomyces microflavus TaxID=1919 RepID=UPI003326A483
MDWEAIAQQTLVRFPADYREFVETYGGGEVDEYFSVDTPPVPGSPYGDLLDKLNPTLHDSDRRELLSHLPGKDLPLLLPFAGSASSDVAFWLREGAPDDWRVAVFRRQTPPAKDTWSIFDGGMAAFFVAVLTGEADPFSSQINTADQHTFVSWRPRASGDNHTDR